MENEINDEDFMGEIESFPDSVFDWDENLSE